MEITELRREDEKAWDSHGRRDVAARTYKHRPLYSVAKEGERYSQSKNLKSVL